MTGARMARLTPSRNAEYTRHSGAAKVLTSRTPVLWRADGSNFPAEYWSYPIRRDGEIVGAVVTFLDITERRRLEAQFRQSQQRLRHIVVSSQPRFSRWQLHRTTR